MNFSAWLPIAAVFLVAAAVAFWHLATHRVPYMPKWAWILLVIVGFPFGSIIYIAVVMFGAGTVREDAEGRPIDE